MSSLPEIIKVLKALVAPSICSFFVEFMPHAMKVCFRIDQAISRYGTGDTN